MTHTPAVDSLEQLRFRLSILRTAMVADGDEWNAGDVLAEAIAALTRPVGGSERLRELAVEWRRMSASRTFNPAFQEACRVHADILEAALASPQGAEQRQEALQALTREQERLGLYAPAQAASQGDAVPQSLRELWQIDHDLFDEVREIVGLKGKQGNVIERVRELAALSSPTGVRVDDAAIVRDRLWCEAIVGTQKWSAEFGAMACETAELLHYFNARRPGGEPVYPSALAAQAGGSNADQ